MECAESPRESSKRRLSSLRLNALLRHLRIHGCRLKREGRSHSIWINPNNGVSETIPRHSEIDNVLARKICRTLSIPQIGRE